jgi:hypothetical protein
MAAMKTLRALQIFIPAIWHYVRDEITEQELKDALNRARELIGRDPI